MICCTFCPRREPTNASNAIISFPISLSFKKRALSSTQVSTLDRLTFPKHTLKLPRDLDRCISCYSPQALEKLFKSEILSISSSVADLNPVWVTNVVNFASNFCFKIQIYFKRTSNLKHKGHFNLGGDWL